MLAISHVPVEVAKELGDVPKLAYLSSGSLANIMKYTSYGVKGTDLGLCLSSADDFIKLKG